MQWPKLTIYTDRLPEWAGGQARGPLVLIRPRYRNDSGLHAHEEEHVRQWYIAWAICTVAVLPIAALLDIDDHWFIALSSIGMSAHGLLYYFVRRYRTWCEARAYAIQTQRPDANGNRLRIDEAADMLSAANYALRITKTEALALIAKIQLRL